MADPTPRLIEELSEVGRSAHERQLVLASAGNLSARIPGRDACVITASGTWLGRLTPEDFSVIDLDGRVLAGHPRPSSEWKLHARTYRVRPDVNAVVHLHPLTAVMLDACGVDIRLILQDHAFYLRRISRVPFNPNGSDELADTAAEASRNCNVVILAHHGCSTLGDTVAMAFRRALNLEEAARATVLALQLGDRATVFPPEAFAALRHA